MNIAVIGSGGREHAIALKISESKLLNELFVIPGNPGTTSFAKNVNIESSNYDEIVEFCKFQNIDLVVIGPEQPLVDGLSDLLKQNNINVFGPSGKAALIEGDKAFAKELMKKYDIPTADFEIFEKENYEEAIEYLNKLNYPIVVKACGLAAGKGVLICNNKREAVAAIDGCFNNNIFGNAGNKIVIEEFLVGEEASIFAVTDGEDYIILPPSQDHKRIYDGDKGKNTGGMGAYAPAPIIDDNMMRIIERKIVSKTIEALRKENKSYSGCLYCGLMITDTGPQLIEYNCRFGDPETQVVLPIIEGDFLELLDSTARGKLNIESIEYKNSSAVCVIAASKGYPDKYEKGFEIKGLNNISEDNIIVYHAGTKLLEDKVVTNGGRVLGVTAILKSRDIKNCKTMSYNALSKVYFEGIYYRKDIADRAIKE